MTRETSDGDDRGDGSKTSTKTETTASAHTRRRILAGAGAATATGLAGCSGILGGDGGNGGGSEFTQEDSGSVDSNEVGELEIVGWTSEVADGSFQVTVTIRNTGSESTPLIDYGYELMMYDGDGSPLARGGINARSSHRVDSGATGEVPLSSTGLSDPEAVERYEISLECDAFSDGVYCE